MPVEDAKTLGRLEQAVEQLGAQSAALFRKSDESQAQLAALAATIEHIAALLKELRGEVKELRAKVGELQSARDRGLGVLTGVGLLGGSLGAVASRLLGGLSGGGH